jgi:hypothetical protein
MPCLIGHRHAALFVLNRLPLGATFEQGFGLMPMTDVAIRNAKPRAEPHQMGDAGGLFLLVQALVDDHSASILIKAGS